MGRRAWTLLAAGQDPEEVVGALIAGDAAPAQRQFGIVDAQGRSATLHRRGVLRLGGRA